MIDKLNFEQFKGLLARLDLAPEKDEPEPAYHYRVARKIGVQLDNDGVRNTNLAKLFKTLSLT